MAMNMLTEKIDWDKMNGLIPAIVQDAISQKVLMLGYMNKEALEQTMLCKRLTFYSRSRQALWLKGEKSGNYLQLCDIYSDCDNDSLLITANPTGPTCHQGTISCYTENAGNIGDAGDTGGAGNTGNSGIISDLEKVILQRQRQRTSESYVASLFNSGISRIAQKVGEEGVEVALAAVLDDKKNVCAEVADLLFHVLVLLRARDLSFREVLDCLSQR